MSTAVDNFFNAMDKIDDGINELFGVMRDVGVDLAEDNFPRELRAIQERFSGMRRDFEDLGFGNG